MKTKKELKEAYKQKKPVAGIFQLQNKVSGKVLIEGSPNAISKWNRHRTELRFGSHRNKQLQNDWNTQGEDSFIFSLISELKIKEGESIDLKTELALLKELVMEELNIHDDMIY